MPSSIFSSEFPANRAPKKPWLRICALAVIISITPLFGLEVFLRRQDLRASVTDNLNLWASHRSRIYGNNNKAVVLIGASRMQTDFSLLSFKSRFPDYQITQLAIPGTGPISTLEDIADDQDFKGIIICSLTAFSFDRDSQQNFVNYYHSAPIYELNTEPRIQSFLQTHFVFLNQALNMKAIAGRLRKGESIPKTYTVMDSDRSVSSDFRQIDIQTLKNKVLKDLRSGYESRISYKKWLNNVNKLEKTVQKISRRGGKVIFVRLPTSGEHWALDQKYFPRSLYWDRLEKLTKTKTIHFQDFDSLAYFKCPDTSHLDYRDTPRFTNALLDELVHLKVLF